MAISLAKLRIIEERPDCLRNVVRGILAAGLLIAGTFAPVDQARAEARDFEPVQKRFTPAQKPRASKSFVAEDQSLRPMLSDQSVIAMQSAIAKYEFIVSRGGWRAVPPGRAMSTGSRGDRVVMLRDRLAISGDLQAVSADAGRYDKVLVDAVKRFQRRMGLPVTGAVDDETLKALNVPAHVRLRTLKVNLPRVAEAAQGLGNRYVIVNIPAVEVESVEDGFVYSRHVAIVGKIDRQTPEITSQITQLNFNPYWHVPESIIRKDLLPQLRKDPSYLQQMNIRVHQGYGGPEVDPSTVDWSLVDEKTYTYRQDPGDKNSMGTVKINFPNKHAVYMHDTPTKSLFTEAARLLSSGCVRVENVHVLTEWLLRGQDQWNRELIDQVAGSQERLDVDLANPVPLRFVYLTAWARADGVVSFRPDIYERDVTSVASSSGVVETQ